MNNALSIVGVVFNTLCDREFFGLVFDYNCEKFLSPIATSMRLSAVERDPVLCTGRGDPCDGNQCCGFAASNILQWLPDDQEI